VPCIDDPGQNVTEDKKRQHDQYWRGAWERGYTIPDGHDERGRKRDEHLQTLRRDPKIVFLASPERFGGTEAEL
jgi:hypothetical protein